MSLRARLMLIASAAVAMALVIAGAALYLLTARGVNAALDTAARASASQIVGLHRDGGWPDPLPATGGQLIQVVDAQSRVLAASINADRLTPLAQGEQLAQARTGRVVVIDASRAALAGQLRVVAAAVPPRGVGEDSAGATVLVASATSDVDAGRSVLRGRMLVILPIVLGALLFLAWRMIGSALAPVEQLRQGAARIGAGPVGAQPEQLPVPRNQDEIQALATTLNEMLTRLQDAGQRQRVFIADAAHELRSPLAAIRTDLEVSQRLGEGGELPARLLPELERLSQLVDDLLTLARSGQERPLRAEPVDLADLLDAVIPRYRSARVRLEWNPPATDAVVMAEPDDVRRAITNIIDNAVRHARTAVRVELSAAGGTGTETTQGGSAISSAAVQLLIADDGAGIPADQRERVFDRFARLSEARDRDSGGSGLGLPISRALLARHGGTITLEDADPGVRVRIRLPGVLNRDAVS